MKVVAEGTFDAAHLLSNYEGKCKNLHGHTYKYEIRVSAVVDEGTAMVVDFNTIKSITDAYDHALLLPEHRLPIEQELFDFAFNWRLKVKIIEDAGRTTAERIANQIVREIQDEVKQEGAVVSIRLWETPKHYVEVLS